MKNSKFKSLKVKTKTLVTFENKSINRTNQSDTDPTTTTIPTSGFPFDLKVVKNS